MFLIAMKTSFFSHIVEDKRQMNVDFQRMNSALHGYLCSIKANRRSFTVSKGMMAVSAIIEDRLLLFVLFLN